MAEINVGVLGASGYVGEELLRMLVAHPNMSVCFAGGGTTAGEQVSNVCPNLAAGYEELSFEVFAPSILKNLDVLFSALPHGETQQLVASGQLSEKILQPDANPIFIDLSADFRLKDPADYDRWYGEPHSAPQLLEKFSYGLPELFRDDLHNPVAVPGCYPTATALALVPLLRSKFISPKGIIVDAASGVSGAGRKLAENTSFCSVEENFSAYGLCDHRHTPEIQQAIEAEVLFTPHLAPMNRGILATCYAIPDTDQKLDTETLLDCYQQTYKNEPFVHVSSNPPSTKATLGSNAAHLTARFDTRTHTVIALCAIDNLGKGAAGQAIQCANYLCGLTEDTGLSAIGVYP